MKEGAAAQHGAQGSSALAEQLPQGWVRYLSFEAHRTPYLRQAAGPRAIKAVRNIEKVVFY